MKIVFLDGFTLNPGDLSWQSLDEFGDVTVYDRTSSDEVLERIAGAEAVFTNKTVLTDEHFNESPSIRFIGVLATGYDVVDIKAARERNITVCNVPTYGTSSVAQYTMALLLEICHHVAYHNSQVQNGEWARRGDFCFWDYPLIELSGKILGLVGFGKIGRAVAMLANSFGMKTIAFDPMAEAEELVEYDELLAKSDVISLHCPLLPATKHIINADALNKMKNGVIILNTSRGQLIDEEALSQTLKDGKVYAAAVDVVSSEPIRPDNPLLGLSNCIITPHIAWAPKESRQRLLDISIENLRQFLKGTPCNVIELR